MMLPIYIRPYVLDDAAVILEMNLRNREHFEYWMPVKPLPEQYTLEGQRERIFRHQELMKQDAYYAYGVFLSETDQLIGDVSAMFIQRGPAETCMIGYQLDAVYGGKGYMAQAVGLFVDHLFDVHQFHRIRAEVMPANVGSIRVLEKVGFRKEGIAKQNLFINDAWEDFILFALLKEDREESGHANL